MATNRMFSSEIVEDYDFCDMPLSAQALYFHLGMGTDNRGYISNALSTIKLIGAKKEDLQVLIQRRYILVRGERLLLQKHFPRNNKNIRQDKSSETTFIEDFKKIFLNENGDYTERDTGVKAIEVKPYKRTNNLLEMADGNRTGIGQDISDTKRKEKKLNESKLNESKVNKIDKTRYKHFEKCDQLVDKLISSAYITENDLELEDYYNYFDNLLEFVSPVDLKVKVDYFINQTTTLKANNGDLYRELAESIKNVSNKFLYFKTAIDRALQN